MRNDLRFALRALLRDRAFSITAILVLALGIGANTAVFSLVNSVLLKPLAYNEPERLVVMQRSDSANWPTSAPTFLLTLRHYAEWKTLGSFREIALVDKAEFESHRPRRSSAGPSRPCHTELLFSVRDKCLSRPYLPA